MHQFIVNALPVDQVITDLARAMSTDVQCDCDYYWIDLPASLGEGCIGGINFGGGLGMIKYDCTFIEDVRIDFTIDQVHPVKFQFCYLGEYTHGFASDNQKRRVKRYANIVVASARHGGHQLWFTGGVRVCLFSIEVNRQKFNRRYNCQLLQDDSDLSKMLMDSEGSKRFAFEGLYNLRVYEMVQEMLAFEPNDLLRVLYYESKSLELLVRLWRQYRRAFNTGQSTYHLHPEDIDRIREVAGYIHTHLQEDLTVESIARRAGMGVNKLQEGFQILYQNSVNKFVQRSRLDRARELLETGQYNVSETLAEIGISSKSYFTNLFKRHFGITPSKFRQTARSMYPHRVDYPEEDE